MGTIVKVAAGSIAIPEVKLRDVNTSDEKYVGLVMSIRKIGFQGCITASEAIDKVSGKKYYELVDGLHRLTAFKEVYGVDAEINVEVDTIGQMEVLRRQFALNFHKVETRPVQYGEHIKQMLLLDPLLTTGTLADSIGVTRQYIEDRLGIARNIADESIRKAIDEGIIPAVNAIHLAKLPSDEQVNFLSAATGKSDDFVPAVRQRLNEINAAKRAGLAAKAPEFVPVTKARSPAELRALDDSKITEIIGDATTALEGAKRLAAWCIHADPASVAEQKAKWEADRQADADRKAKREEEKAAKARAAVV